MDLLSGLLKSVEEKDRQYLDSAIEEQEAGFAEIVSENPKFDFEKEIDFHKKLELLYLWMVYPPKDGAKVNVDALLKEFIAREWKSGGERVAAYGLYDRLVEINNRKQMEDQDGNS